MDGKYISRAATTLTTWIATADCYCYEMLKQQSRRHKSLAGNHAAFCSLTLSRALPTPLRSTAFAMSANQLRALVSLCIVAQGCGTLQDDFTWLSNQTQSLLKGCQLVSSADPGTTLFTPDAAHGYGAQWTRDFVRRSPAGLALRNFLRVPTLLCGKSRLTQFEIHQRGCGM